MILVGLEGAATFEEAQSLEFGRGFRYTRPLRLNTMDLDYELMEELVRVYQSDRKPVVGRMTLEYTKYCFPLPFRITLPRGSAVECHANVLALEGTEEASDSLDPKYYQLYMFL